MGAAGVIIIMWSFDQNREADAQAIVAFLSSLEGELPTDYIKQPELPESGPDTPAADPN